MELLTIKPIPTREWKVKKEMWELVVERDKNRKKSQQIVDERIHYMWFKYLQLCINLEEINYYVLHRGRGGITKSKTKVKISKSIYRKWDLEKVKKSSFSEWYKGGKYKLLFYDGGFQYKKNTQYHSLVKRYNVFIEYHNMMNGGFVDDTGGRLDKGMRVSEKIVEDLQKEGGQKERYEILQRDDIRYGQGTDTTPSSVRQRVMQDVVGCENTVLAVCEGRFPK